MNTSTHMELLEIELKLIEERYRQILSERDAYMKELADCRDATGPYGDDMAAAIGEPLEVADLVKARFTALTEQNAKLMEALERLGSLEAFTHSRSIDRIADAELIARIEYARRALTPQPENKS